MLITCDADVVDIRAIFVGKLDLYVVIVTDFVDGGSFLANDVRMVLGVNLENDREAFKGLVGGREEGGRREGGGEER